MVWTLVLQERVILKDEDNHGRVCLYFLLQYVESPDLNPANMHSNFPHSVNASALFIFPEVLWDLVPCRKFGFLQACTLFSFHHRSKALFSRQVYFIDVSTALATSLHSAQDLFPLCCVPLRLCVSVHLFTLRVLHQCTSPYCQRSICIFDLCKEVTKNVGVSSPVGWI